VPKRHLAATLKAIHDEAARHMPDAIKQIEANVTGEAALPARKDA
jgi:hypothetical protein